MLTLADSRRLPHATLFRDVSWADGTRALTPQVYALADEPRLGSSSGGPAYTLYRYRGAPGSAPGGGLLVLNAVLTDPEATPGAVRAAYGLTDGDPVTVSPPPLSAATARVALAGESTAGEFVESVSCSTDASTGGVSVVCVLTQDGVTLLDQAAAQGLAPVHLEVDLALGYVLDDLEVTVWCDARSSLQVGQDLAAAGRGSPAALLDELVARHLAGTTVVSARPLTDDEQVAVAALTDQVLRGVVLPQLTAVDGSLVPWSPELESRVNLTLTASAPGTVDLTRTGNLDLPDPSAHTVSTDLDDGLRRVVRVAVAGDLAALGIAVVAVALDYAGTLADGTAVRRSADLELRPGNPASATIFDLAAADQRAVTGQVTVHYADGSTPYAFDLPATAADAVVLDVDALGVVAVDLALVGADPGMRVTAVVDLTCTGAEGDVKGRVVLDAAQPVAQWTAVVRELPQPCRYQVTWVRAEARVTQEWIALSGNTLRLVPPFDAPSGTVTVVSAGEFDQLSALVVQLQAGAAAPVTTMRFTAPDQTQTWTTEAGTPYVFRTTLVRPDGSHPDGPAGTTDLPVLVVRDTLRFDVTVVPVMLGLGPAVSRAIVELESPDPAAPHTTLVFDPPAMSQRATLRLADPGVHDYRYRVTLRPPAGPPRTGDWQGASSTVLVPLAAPAGSIPPPVPASVVEPEEQHA